MATFREKSIMFEMFIILLIFVSSVLVSVHCNCVGVTQQFSKQNVTLTFHLLGKKTPLQVNHGDRLVYMQIDRKMKYIPLENSEDYEVIKSTNQEFSFKIVNVTKNHAGIYNLIKMGTGGSLECKQLVITDKPGTIILNQSQPVLRGEYRKGNIALTCNATSATKPVDHNLPMIYRWFKHGIYYGNGGNSRILQDRDVDITEMGHDIICIATDDPECKTSLQNLKQDVTLTTVTEDKECKDVVGVSEKFNIQPLYGPYNITLIYDNRNLKPSEEIQKRIGEELSVNCTSDCNPACNISWYKDEKMLSLHTQLNLQDLQDSDDGVYTCTVYNIHGTRNISFNLSTKAKKAVQPLNKTSTTMITTAMEEDNKHQPANDGNQPFIIILGLSIGVVLLVIIVSVLIVVFICMKIRNVSGGYTKSKKRRKKKKSSAQKVYPGWRTNENQRDDDERLFEAIELHRGAALADTKRNFANFKLREAHNNIEELIYADLDLPLCNNNIIHGQKYKIIYGVIDFNKVPPPRPCGYVSEEDSSSSSSS